MHEITINDEQRLILMSVFDEWFLRGGLRTDADDRVAEFVVRLNTLLQKAATA